MDEFLDQWDGQNSSEVWRCLRTKGLGQYVDRPDLPEDSSGK